MNVNDFSTSMSATYALNRANSAAAQANERISTTQRINSAKDDPAGYAKAVKLKAEIGSFTKAIDNINAGISLVQSVDDSIGQVSEILVKMRELAVSAAGENKATTRATYQTTFSSYLTDITNIVSRTTYNGASVLDGTTASVDVQTGINASETKTLTFFNMSTTSLGISTVDLSTSTANASAAISTIDTAISTAGGYLTSVGAYENALSFNNELANSNIQSKSKEYGNIMNADMAAEATNLAAAQIQQSSAAAMVAQGNLMNREMVSYLLKAYTG
ncbi:MAG: flagellin [Oxalobacteraceae bacterium]